MGEVEKDDPEVKGATCAASSHATLVDHSAASVDKLIRHYSDWYRLKKAVAVFPYEYERFCENEHRKGSRSQPTLAKKRNSKLPPMTNPRNSQFKTSKKLNLPLFICPITGVWP
ncbi:hypothetical protein QZH41_001267 [Actinostola sp. cb2023]|nr:hypothetical protein QZH41_001267 [Actinostola sp. cb2023]